MTERLKRQFTHIANGLDLFIFTSMINAQRLLLCHGSALLYDFALYIYFPRFPEKYGKIQSAVGPLILSDTELLIKI